MTEVSVVIPTYNRAEKVGRAVSSVLLQTYRDFEVIVVDDGSTDHTERVLSQFGGKIVLVVHASNRGVSSARNTGIGLSRSPYVAFLDSDDYWYAGKLAVQMEFFRKHPHARICQTEERWIRRGRRVNPRRRHLKPDGDIFRSSLKLCVVSPSSAMMEKALLLEVGLFDEGLPACEDYDLWLRISSRYPVHLIPKEMVVREGGHEDQLSSRYMGMDRFRIRALAKLISAGRLTSKQREEALSELASKCRIYGEGCLKRGKWEEGLAYLELPAGIGEESGR